MRITRTEYRVVLDPRYRFSVQPEQQCVLNLLLDVLCSIQSSVLMVGSRQVYTLYPWDSAEVQHRGQNWHECVVEFYYR